MSFKKITLFTLLICFLSGCFMLCGFTFFKKNTAEKTIQTVTKDYSKTENNLWCVTFQLVWNDLMDKFTNGSVILDGGNPPIADELNKRLYDKSIISENSYYTANGKISTELKKTIEKDIYKKFKEKSDILNLIDWNAKDSYLFYAILKKDFIFLTQFDRLNSDTFNGGSEKVKYFGIIGKSNKKLRENVQVLFYNSADEYAVKLLTKENEDVILYRTDKEDSFTNLYNYIAQNTEFDSFTEKDVLQIPDITVDETISYNDLCGKKIQGTDYVISQALQTIKFKMDDKGGSLKSEAAIAVMRTALTPPVKNPRFFLFNKRFILFLKEANKDKPYYAMTVEDSSSLVKDN